MAELTGLGCCRVHHLSSVGGLGQILTRVRLLNNLGNICSDLFEFTMSYLFGINRIECTQETNLILNIQLAVRFCWEVSFKALDCFIFSLIPTVKRKCPRCLPLEWLQKRFMRSISSWLKQTKVICYTDAHRHGIRLHTVYSLIFFIYSGLGNYMVRRLTGMQGSWTISMQSCGKLLSDSFEIY